MNPCSQSVGDYITLAASVFDWIVDIHDWIIAIHVRIMDIHNTNNWFMDSLDQRMDIDYRAYTSAFPR